MGFRKASYDVEEKGLDPTKPHKEIGKDGRLTVVPNEPAVANSLSAETQEEKSTQKPSLAVTATEHEKQEVTTPSENVSLNIELLDEPPQMSKELSDDKPKTRPRKKTVAAKTTPSSKTKKTRNKKAGV